MNFLITGGAGFIGSHIADALVKNGDKVKVLDDFSSGKKENLAHLEGNIEIVEGDIRDKTLVSQIMPGIDYVLHQAALRSVPKSLDNPELYNDVNINGTLNILTMAKKCGAKRVVCASSSSVYGDAEKLPNTEDLLPMLISPYALTKLSAEYYCRIFSKLYDLETVNLRYFNVFGPRQSLENEYAVVIPKFITCMLKGQNPPVHGDGEQTRDFTYVENVVEGNIRSAVAPGVKCEVFNIACGEAYSVLDIIRYVNKILGKDIKPEFESSRKGDVKHTLADISKAEKILNYKPGINFEKGLNKTVEYFKNIK